MPLTSTSKKSTTNQHSKKRKGSSHSKTTDAPIFLRKTFHLIESLTEKEGGEIASWTSDGKSFVVKDPDRFAAEAVPQCFNHHKFSSFVRQLNFYGFRKLKPENSHIYLKNIDHTQNKWAYFFHPKFQRGHPEWLKQIRKPHQVEAADKEEVGALKSEVKALQSQVKNLTSNVEILASLMRDMHRQLQNQQPISESAAGNGSTDSESKTKKRRISVSPEPAVSSPAVMHPIPERPVVPGPTTRQPSVDLSWILKSDDLLIDETMPDESKSFSFTPPLKSIGPASRQASADLSITQEDNEFLASLFEET